jgi:alkaline phosphatase D
MKQIHLAGLILLLVPTLVFAKAKPNLSQGISRIAFGSCVHQDHKQPIWKAINREHPDLFVFLGDNIYGDTEDMDELKRKYQKLGANAGFKTLREQSHIVATWDDHDYGADDVGAEYPQKEASRQIMLDFWKEPTDSARRTRPDGIYSSQIYGKPGQSVQLILLDLRWNRSPLKGVSKPQYLLKKAPQNLGPYEPITDSSAQLLGEAQWQWLETQLQQPADLRVIASSIQLLAEFTGWESWANFPHERRRLFDLINKHKVNGLFIISGDTHWSEFSKVAGATAYPLWEATSSGLTEEWKAISPNQHRLGNADHRNNYGLIEINWTASEPSLTVSIKGQSGQVYIQNTLRISELQYPKP